MVEEETPDFEGATIELPSDKPGLSPARPRAKGRKEQREALAAPRRRDGLRGNLMIASHIDFLLKVIVPENLRRLQPGKRWRHPG